MAGTSEIDDIFATKGKPDASGVSKPTRLPPASDSSSHTSKKSKKGKLKEQERKSTIADKTPPEEISNQLKTVSKRPVPETVIDPSLRIAPPKKPRLPTHSIPSGKIKSVTAAAQSDSRPSGRSYVQAKKDEEAKATENADERFKDSRGTGPRRKTEEGYLIYKEAELGISENGGDTPLCPFDCDCCY